MADCCEPALTVLTLTANISALGWVRIMLNTPICWETPDEQHISREILTSDMHKRWKMNNKVNIKAIGIIFTDHSLEKEKGL